MYVCMKCADNKGLTKMLCCFVLSTATNIMQLVYLCMKLYIFSKGTCELFGFYSQFTIIIYSI